MASTGQTGSLQNQAQGVLNQTKDSARAVAGEQQRAAAGGLAEFAGALRKAARETGDGGQRTQVARFAESAADGLERVSDSLREKDLNRLVGDIESFARSQPVAFFGAAVAVGFLAVRFLKATAPASTPNRPDTANLSTESRRNTQWPQ